MEITPCFIVIHNNYADGLDAYAFRQEEDAVKSVSEDAETVMTELKDCGYEPCIYKTTCGHTEIYALDRDIYYEWDIVPSQLE